MGMAESSPSEGGGNGESEGGGKAVRGMAWDGTVANDGCQIVVEVGSGSCRTDLSSLVLLCLVQFGLGALGAVSRGFVEGCVEGAGRGGEGREMNLTGGGWQEGGRSRRVCPVDPWAELPGNVR